ncbi:MAG TPA: IclR family transcriptional regulator C-terminal domain-containing protein [Cellulomonas sp.]
MPAARADQHDRPLRLVRPAERTDGMATLSRGLEILDLVQRAGCVRIADMAEQLDMPLSTAYRYVRQLREARFLLQVDGSLLPSPRFRDQDASEDHLVGLAEPVLRRMRVATGLTAILAVRVHTAALILDVLRALPRYQVSFAPGEVRALHAGASVTPLLAYAPPSIIEGVLARGLRRYTSATPSAQEVRDEIDRIRTDGYAASHGQVNPGMMALGMPVLLSGRCVCAVSIVGRTASFERFGEALGALRRGASELAAGLGEPSKGDAWVVEGM